MELNSIRRCFITYRESDANNTPHSHDVQRGDADSDACIPPHIFPAKPPPYFFT